jgi:hypothetical protein
LLLGNDIAGGNVTPVLEVVDNSEIRTTDEKLVQTCFSCLWAQSRKLGDVVDLASFIFENFEVEDNAPSIPSARQTIFTGVKTKAGESEIAPQLYDILLYVTPEKVIECQKGDTSRRKCFASVISIEEAKTKETAYFMKAGVLMSKWAAQ